MGGRPLNGTAAIPAAKNSVLPLLAAALLCRGPVRLRAVPRLSDVECSLGLLRGAGCAAYWQGADIVVAGMPSNSTLPGETAAQMRASILFCAPLLARLGRAEEVASKIVEDAQLEAETLKKETIIEAKDEVHKLRGAAL
mgnify:CR=1 FL=1